MQGSQETSNQTNKNVERGKKAAKIALGLLLKKKALLYGTYIVVPLFIIFFVFYVIMAAYYFVESNKESDMPEFVGAGLYEVELSELGKEAIPEEYIATYKRAANQYGLPWTLLAGIHRVETVFSTIPQMESHVGARGHMQFMPCTWVGWSYSGCGGLGNSNMSDSNLTSIKNIEEHGGYGVDANNDGKADPYDIEDAVFSAANYIHKNGGNTGDFEGAVLAYNHADWYVDKVMGFFDDYTDSYRMVEAQEGGTFPGSGNGSIEAAIDRGMAIVGKSPYVWGGGRNQADINARRFDCSSFVRWAYEGGGVNLGPVASTNTDSLVTKGKPILGKANLKRGDLVFFDTYKRNGHVGIYLGGSKVLNDASSKGVSILDMNSPYWSKTYKGVNRRVVE